MNGTWKENIAGYSKDCRRKKQTRKHTLKDKAKWHIKHSEIRWKIKKSSSRTKIEGDIKCNFDNLKVKKELYVPVFVIEVDNYKYSKTLGDDYKVKPEGFFEGNTKQAFRYRNDWYDIYTYKKIEGIIKPLNKIDTIYIPWDENLQDTENKNGCRISTTKTIFLYGKPLCVNYWNEYGFWSTKARKYAQKKANSMDRQRVRNYIAEGDWDKEIKTHHLSKSIAWEIY